VDEQRPILNYHRPPAKSRLPVVRRSVLAIILVACVVAWGAQAMNDIPRQTAYEVIGGLLGIALVVQVIVRPHP
jgi:hypothetical protein